MRDGLGRFKSKRKRHRGSNGDKIDESLFKIVKRKLLENVSPYKVTTGNWQPTPPKAMRILCWNCRRIGNPVTIRELKQLLVANDPEVIFLCETKVHTNKFVSIRSKCRMEGCLVINAICKSGGGFYGNDDPNKRQSSCDMLRKVGKSIKEKWIIEGDFNAILNNVEKYGGRRKPKTLIDDFHAIVHEFLLVDLKMDKGW
ncbi:hypothetical protein PVK06_033974 [Gossypium arboreum]|uniref:Reverse transcriptase n=1 Tax=Gossypium arboreum TaxID=29729 RepID=A0ABR0NCX9_GOSAR|nr:hypothetical protein PVK06_033974 [Gossypium arboreum]